MKGEKIQLSDSVLDVCVKMSEGNPGACTVCAELIKADPIDGVMDLLQMDDMGMRGPAIWIAYKDFAHMDLTVLQQAIRHRDPAMLNCIRNEGYDVRENRFA